jgi:hypothetical protein
MRFLGLLTCAAFVVCLGVAPSQAEKRVALVIGNSAYKNAPALPNSRNDAEDVTAAAAEPKVMTLSCITFADYLG